MKNKSRYSGKIVLVTGASRGIGRAISFYFLNQGATVIGFDKGEPTISKTNYHHI